ncbi:hypothetical protein VNI00_007148 [Paramarasmius palmivorus]|uniref:Cytochrome P450 n=1 Tax=Paramarasmius palmivorus TaxID=297713 RepID=A0AAW0D153_9AGAR
MLESYHWRSKERRSRNGPKSMPTGDVMYLKVFNREMIVLNSIEAAHDLLDKRSANYSSRPYFPILEMMGWGGTIVLMRYGKQYIKLRKTFQQYFYHRETLVRDFVPVQTREARLLAKNLLTGTAPVDAVGRFGIANSMSMTYGSSLFSAEPDTYVHLGHEIEDAVNNGGPVGGTPVDFFPILARFPSWFPGTYYGRRALMKRPIVRRIFDYPWEQFVAKRKTEKYNEPCFVTHLLHKAMEGNPSNDQGLSTEEIEEIKGQASAAYTGGFDTVRTFNARLVYATIMVFLLSMVLHPEEQQKAQKEIDTVVGNTRLPQFEDRPSLPYVESVLQEVLRWGPAVPLGDVPRLSPETSANEL